LGPERGGGEGVELAGNHGGFAHDMRLRNQPDELTSTTYFNAHRSLHTPENSMIALI
jgi:hypothetical protein